MANNQVRKTLCSWEHRGNSYRVALHVERAGTYHSENLAVFRKQGTSWNLLDGGCLERDDFEAILEALVSKNVILGH